jgi:hypothetical protein
MPKQKKHNRRRRRPREVVSRGVVIPVIWKRMKKIKGCPVYGLTSCVGQRSFLIEMEEKLKPPWDDYVLLHEVLHTMLPDASEDAVEEMTQTLWINFTVKYKCKPVVLEYYPQ